MQAIRQKMPLPGSDPKDSDSSDFHMNFCYIFIVSVYEMYVKLFCIFCDRYFVSAISPYFCKKPDSPSAASHFTQRLSFRCSVILPRGLFYVIGTLWNNFLFHKKCGSANIFLFTEPHFTTMIYFFYLFLFCLILQIAFPVLLNCSDFSYCK